MSAPLHPNQPRALAELDNVPQALDENTVQPQQSQIKQIATAALESERSPPIFQQVETVSRVFDVVGADEEVEQEGGGEGEVCAGICVRHVSDDLQARIGMG
jgi:hypothetical protein